MTWSERMCHALEMAYESFCVHDDDYYVRADRAWALVLYLRVRIRRDTTRTPH